MAYKNSLKHIRTNFFYAKKISLHFNYRTFLNLFFLCSPERSDKKTPEETLIVKENVTDSNGTLENTNNELNSEIKTDVKSSEDNTKTSLDKTHIEKLPEVIEDKEKNKRKEQITYLVSKLNEKTSNYREAMLKVSSNYESGKMRPRSRSSNR